MFGSYKYTPGKKVENYKLKKNGKRNKSCIKTNRKAMQFHDTEIQEDEFHQYKCPVLIYHININEIVVSDKFPFGIQDFKYFISYKDNKEIRSVCIFVPEMSIYKGQSDKTKYIYILLKKNIRSKKFLRNI